MADQCIVCLESLDVQGPPCPSDSSSDPKPGDVDAGPPPDDAATSPLPPPTEPAIPSDSELLNLAHDDDKVAVIEVCGHSLHDACLREWTGKANSCPICRQAFHLVQVYDKVGGTLLSSYKVEDKKQVAEFDPRVWLAENPEAPEEEEPSTPCPICNSASHEEVLLLCDGCDTAYHTHCLGLDAVPSGSWFCMECEHVLGDAVQQNRPQPRGRRSDFFPRTQASMRRARRRARSDEWQGAWGQIAGRIWDALSIDLDYHDEEDDDDAMEEYRRSQQLRERERREYERWQQRLNIASRLGARDVFAQNIPPVFNPANAQQEPHSQETREERKAWGALERARECNVPSPGGGGRKRRARSITGSPAEPEQQPERKLKRPRTRRLPVQGEPSSSHSPAATAMRPESNGVLASARSPAALGEAPSFLSSLLKEVEMSAGSDDETIRGPVGANPYGFDASSPVTSPSASAHNSPRALSSTPPPFANNRPSSPILSLSSHIEPVYPPANYSPTRSNGGGSDGEQRIQQNGAGSSELRQPRPRRRCPAPRSEEASPTRSVLPLEMKENISSIVRSALKPHWKSSKLNSDQYAAINRDVSRKLYEEVADPSLVGEDAKRRWEKVAAKEVAQAVADLKA